MHINVQIFRDAAVPIRTKLISEIQRNIVCQHCFTKRIIDAVYLVGRAVVVNVNWHGAFNR